VSDVRGSARYAALNNSASIPADARTRQHPLHRTRQRKHATRAKELRNARVGSSVAIHHVCSLIKNVNAARRRARQLLCSGASADHVWQGWQRHVHTALRPAPRGLAVIVAA
jgi:hypothetical protein